MRTISNIPRCVLCLFVPCFSYPAILTFVCPISLYVINVSEPTCGCGRHVECHQYYRYFIVLLIQFILEHLSLLKHCAVITRVAQSCQMPEAPTRGACEGKAKDSTLDALGWFILHAHAP